MLVHGLEIICTRVVISLVIAINFSYITLNRVRLPYRCSNLEIRVVDEIELYDGSHDELSAWYAPFIGR